MSKPLEQLFAGLAMDSQTLEAVRAFDTADAKLRRQINARLHEVASFYDRINPSYAAQIRTLALNDGRSYGEDPTRPYLVCPVVTMCPVVTINREGER